MEVFSIEEGERIWRWCLDAPMGTVDCSIKNPFLSGSTEQRYKETECTVVLL